MLATFLSPTLGAEALAPAAARGNGMAHHGVAEAAAGMALYEGYQLVAMTPENAPADCDGCPDHHDEPNCAETEHHCCPGSVLGHLPGNLSASIAFALPDSGSFAVDRKNARFSTRTPEGLERPPRAATA